MAMADLKKLCRQIFRDTLTAIDIPGVMQRKLPLYGSVLRHDELAVDLRAFSAVRVVALGKATHKMLQGLRALLPGQMAMRGVASAPTAPEQALPGIQYFVGGHPLPSAQSLRAAEAILFLLAECDEQTLVFFLLSGGGSALAELPLNPRQTLADTQELYRLLITCGAPITAINTVRRHLSLVKGGRLAVAAERATKLTLAVCDVPCGQEEALASGPTLPDPTTVADVERLLTEYRLLEKLPAAVLRWIDQGQMPETPKPGHPAFANAHFVTVLAVDDLFHPAHHAAEAHGCITCCDNATDEWPVEKAAEFLLEQLEQLRAGNAGRRVAVIADGEISSPVTGKGVGGRNCAFVLACVPKIAGHNMAVLSAGTDGMDGNSPAAGAVADGETLARARAAGLDWQQAFSGSDAYTFFQRMDDAIVTGPTGNNLRDFRILLAER